MKVAHNDIIPRKGAQPTDKPTRMLPAKIIPESEWKHPDPNVWNSTQQPYFARSMLSKLVLPALIYSLVMNATQKIFRILPFASPLRTEIEKLHPSDCLAPKLSSSPAGSAPIAIVTGSNTGVGFETASSLAEKGYHVILACRSRQKGEDAANRVNSRLAEMDSIQGGKASFLHPLDLSSFSSVKCFYKAYCDKYDSLNILVNNAGINSQGDTTEDGLEACFQSNFVGHFLLTKLLLGRLLKAKNRYDSLSGMETEAGRVVNLSSVMHHFAPANERAYDTTDVTSKEVPFINQIHDQHFWLGSAIPGLSAGTYRESKLAAILFSMELNKRYGNKGLRSISVNPGSVFSDIWRKESAFTQRVYKMVYLNPKQGSQTSLAGAIGNFPKDAIYLQPYWQPWFSCKAYADSTNSFRKWYKLPFPMTEMLGPYVGHAITEPRLPLDGNGGCKSSEALWNICEKLTE